MSRPGIQLYSLRNVDRPFLDLLELVSSAGFEGVEYAYRVTDAEVLTARIADALDRFGLESAAAHVGIDRLESDLEGAVEFYRGLGCEQLVVPYLDDRHFESRDAVDSTADRLLALADEVADHGATLHYHNHGQELEPMGDGTALDRLIEQTDDRLGIQLDTGFLLLAGLDPVEYIERTGDRLRLLHGTDVDVEAGRSVPLGRGDLDLDACVEAFDGDWLLYEYERDDVLERLDEVGTVLAEATGN